jgi:Lrp/AsnC family transcriptional regulator, leucine-responsive regulatory protein
MPVTELDPKDARILQALQDDARLSVAELSARIGLSTSPCWRRVKRLEKVGLITGYQATIDRRALGLGVLVFVSITIEDHSEGAARAFEKAVHSLPEIVACWSVAGAADFLLQVVSPDLDTYADFAMTTVRRLPGIKVMNTTFTLKEVKAPQPWPVLPSQTKSSKRKRLKSLG